MDMIIRRHNSIELTKNGMHCVIIGDVKDVRDEHIEKMAEWAKCLWDYDKITMWKKSDSMSPGYFIRDSEDGRYKVHVLDLDQKAELFGATRKDSPAKLDNWDKKELLAYVDWFIE
ncbi:hypothetical protein RE476_02155 [Methanolobus mangrovi]|uniref:Uncharacterized protein n=1 Tax=Methanolobus mangrovi TaxID=3072977 RepID=A0AA51UGA2_9EURY|nr:hypothetical protein [Methanolobus mangrovi]WMW22641.1 hypothetical protein RE476_02155 [Methanolobus mangrovi]